ncbi:integration host factor subunit alpha [Desulfoprunum benzoelyticum]|uniref:Integration host factor subunit alpha n=1 Tax=Desulfoprunum benzoelyticum TaxID=1506996 RepID=A0A840V5P3_9BACT|nr:integration host factor subunit alpha [Desulfoprunum benzoelyticum]MBB5349069.1 integration host factor subunit alpha [Desulfoprunum benzoelyticum]MBM9530558.1 integration host factor subunit alpha [Desulfoprunum benzoelyticum]
MNSSNLTRRELAEAIAERLGFSQSNCADIVDCVFDSMKKTLLEGEPIKIVHFGTFSVRSKSPRNGRNPRTGEAITIKKRRTVGFRPSRQLREEINR